MPWQARRSQRQSSSYRNSTRGVPRCARVRLRRRQARAAKPDGLPGGTFEFRRRRHACSTMCGSPSASIADLRSVWEFCTLPVRAALLALTEAAAVDVAVASNSGMYMLPDLAVDFPVGMGGLDLDRSPPAPIPRTAYCILLGDADTDGPRTQTYLAAEQPWLRTAPPRARSRHFEHCRKVARSAWCAGGLEAGSCSRSWTVSQPILDRALEILPDWIPPSRRKASPLAAAELRRDAAHGEFAPIAAIKSVRQLAQVLVRLFNVSPGAHSFAYEDRISSLGRRASRAFLPRAHLV